MNNRIRVIINNIIWLFQSWGWHKDPSIVVMDSWFGQKFADNPRFLFQYLSENKSKLGLTHVVWVTRNENVLSCVRNMGYEAYMLDSKESIYYHKHAKYHICNNAPNCFGTFGGEIATKYSFRSKRINLEHGIGLKGVNYADNAYKEKKAKHPFLYKIKEKCHHYKWFRTLYLEQGGWGDSYYLSTSKANSDILYSYFLLPYDHYVEAAYPRNNECVRLTWQEREVLDKLKQYKYVVLYLPTFRNSCEQIDFMNIAYHIEDILKEKDIYWIQKPHSADKKNASERISSNVLNLESDFDINVLMPYITVLITDYSSVSMDAVYHKKPIIYFVPDYEEYMNSDRGFVINPADYMAGPKVFDVEGLTDTLSEYIENPDKVIDEHYLEIREKFWNEGITYEDIWDAIK